MNADDEEGESLNRTMWESKTVVVFIPQNELRVGETFERPRTRHRRLVDGLRLGLGVVLGDRESFQLRRHGRQIWLTRTNG
jgi:hypothetical protein